MYEKVLNFIDYYKGYYKIKPQKAINTHTPITEIHDSQYKCVGEDVEQCDLSHTAGGGHVLYNRLGNPLWVYE